MTVRKTYIINQRKSENSVLIQVTDEIMAVNQKQKLNLS